MGVIQFVTGPWTQASLFAWLKLIAAFLVFSWLGFQQFSIPTGSMEPTLHGDMRFFRGDRVWVNKWIYGPRVPFMNKRLFRLAEPKRWDIVVFRSVEPDQPRKILVKRVVALGGEKVHLSEGKVYINDELVEPPEDLRDVLHYTTGPNYTRAEVYSFIIELARHHLVPGLLNPEHEDVQSFGRYLERVRERLAGKTEAELTDEERAAVVKDLPAYLYRMARQALLFQTQMTEPYLFGVHPDEAFSHVPEDCYLLLGDNSDKSKDGRVFGWVPNDHILGRVSCIWWPLGRWRDFTGFSKTWWGRSLLFGLPALIILWEILHFLHGRKLYQEATAEGSEQD